MSDLNTRLLDAHARGDRASLVNLYTEAADHAPDTDTACFYLTQAYIFALETAHAHTVQLHTRLKAQGRI